MHHLSEGHLSQIFDMNLKRDVHPDHKVLFTELRKAAKSSTCVQLWTDEHTPEVAALLADDICSLVPSDRVSVFMVPSMTSEAIRELLRTQGEPYDRGVSDAAKVRI